MPDPALPDPFRWEGEHVAAALPGARVLFSSRRGGVSGGPFASLNLGRLTADDGANVDANRERLAAAVADPLLTATDAAEALVRDGVPFRDAHEQVAAQVREGSFTGVETAPRAAPGPGGVHEALAAARMRLGARPVS